MIRYFAAHPTAPNLVMAVFIALGLLFAGNVKRSTFPDVPDKEVEIQVVYPGATAEDVEESICRRIEDAVDGVTNLDEIRCEARENRAIAVAKMIEGKNLDRFMADVKTEVEAIDNFPDQAEKPIIRQLGLVDFVAAVAVTGPMAAPDLKAYADDLKDRLQALDTVSRVDVKGFSDHQIRIEVRAQTLRQYGLSMDDIAGAIARQSVDLPAGTIETRDRDVLVRFADERRTPLQFQDLIVVGGDSGAEIRLGDIATITDRFELDEDRVEFNGRRAAMLEITKTSSEDTLDVIDAVNAFLDQERQVAPPGVTFEVTRDISSIVRDRLDMLIRNGWQGLLLVAATLWLFFSFRFSFWVAMGFPVAFLGTIFVMALAGYSFNMITMVGLLIAIGLLVDDAIVISENIAAHVRRGVKPLKAAIEGTRQVAPGVLASYLTTVGVFGSLAFLKGDIGAILKFMPIILIITLSVSLVEAFLVLPHHISESLAAIEARPETRFRRRLEAAIDWFRDRPVAGLVSWSIRWRYFATGLVLALFLGSISMLAGGHLKFRAFPEIEGNVVEARVLLPQGTPLARTTQIVERLTGAIKDIDRELTPKQPDGRHLVRNINIQYNKNVDAYEVGPHLATVSVDLLSTEVRTAKVDEILKMWRQRVGSPPDVINIKYTEPTIAPAGRPIDLQLQGNDLGELKQAALDLRHWLEGYPGVEDLNDDLRPGKPEFRLRLKEGATSLGFSAQMVATQLRSAFFGKTAAEIQVGPEAYEIDVRLSALDRHALADLEEFTVTAPGGAQVPLSAIAVLETGRGFARINRINGRRTVSIQGDVDTHVGNTSEILADTMARFVPEMRLKHPGVRLVLEGEVKESERTGSSVRAGFLTGLAGVFLLLSFLFRNYVEPLVVMVTIPLALIGVIWGHVLLGLDLSMPSMVGFASLAGVVVNNAILLVEFIKIERRAGMAVAEAAREAARNRFRAILLTTATTIVGLMPLMTEKSLQAQVLIPLVTSITFGLLAATVLVVVIVPALYTILDDFGLTAKVEEKDAEGEAAPTAQPAE